MLSVTSKNDSSKTNLLADDRGLTTVEYVILLMVIAVMSVGAWHSFGSKINSKLSAASDKFGTEAVDTPTAGPVK